MLKYLLNFLISYMLKKILKIQESSISKPLYRTLKIIFHVLNNNFSYTQLFFLLQKDFGIFPVLLFEAFLCFSHSIYLLFLYIYKKMINKFLIVIYHFHIYTHKKFIKNIFIAFKNKL